VIYPRSWVIPLMVCAVLAYVAVAALGLANGRVRVADVVAGVLAFLAVAIVVVALVLAIELRTRAGLGPRWDLLFRYDQALLTGLSAVAILIGGAIFAWTSRRWSWEGLGLGVLGCWLVATVASSLWLAGGSYAFVWPLLGLLAGQAVSFVVPHGGRIAVLASWAGSVPMFLVFLTILPGFFDALNLPMAAPLMIPVLLAAGALVPMVSQVLGSRPRPV
jgi:hypothetical protein